jgi:hypothetical protein
MPANTNTLLANAGFTLSWDFLIIAAAIVAIIFYGFTSGKNKILIMLISTYFSLLAVQFLPWKDLGAYINAAADFPSPTFKIFLFLALIVAFCFLLPSSVLGSGLRFGKTGRSSWYQTVIFAIFEVGLLASAVLYILPVKSLPDLNPLVNQFFLGQVDLFIWIILPILGMVLLRKGRSDI